MSLSGILTEVACKRWPKIQGDLEERTLEIMAHPRYQIEKLLTSSQDPENKSINLSFYLKLKQDFHGGRLQAT